MTREPVAIVNAIVGVVVAVIDALVIGGVLQVDIDTKLQIVAIVTALGTLVATVWSRSLVTPVADPRDNSGRSLKA